MNNVTQVQCKKTSGLAIASLALGLVSLVGGGIFTAVPAVICGHLARKRIRNSEDFEGAGMAKAGLILGYTTLVLFVLLFGGLLIIGSESAAPIIYDLF